MVKNSIGVFGNGFVGGSLTTVFTERGFDVYAYDKGGNYVSEALPIKPGYIIGTRYPSNTKELVEACEKIENFTGIYFVCLPTPMRLSDGSADLSIVEGVLDELAAIPGERIAVIKSTVTPGSTERWNQKYKDTGLRCVFNPEFLTEANAIDDMRNQDRIVLGGPRPHINKVKQVFQKAFHNVPIIKTSSTTAECVKYLTNCYLATKISFANEMKQIVDKLDQSGLNVDYDKVVEYAKFDERLGNYGWQAPGNDGYHGYSLSCLPKDINNMIFIAKQLGVDPKLMKASWDKNLEVREVHDWLELKGRAISDK